MKRAFCAAALAFTSVVYAAGSALAQDYPPSPSVSPTVRGTVERRPKGTAFTGADISLGVVLLVALVVLGVAALLVARRRASAAR
jgi:threonine/homoserine/homoserine lactone efflux protein